MLTAPAAIASSLACSVASSSAHSAKTAGVVAQFGQLAEQLGIEQRGRGVVVGGQLAERTARRVGIRRQDHGDARGVAGIGDGEVSRPRHLDEDGAAGQRLLGRGQREHADEAVLVEVIVRHGLGPGVTVERLEVQERHFRRQVGRELGG